MKQKTFYKNLTRNIGIMQGRMVASEKKNKIQYFPIKNWKKEFQLMAKNKIKKLEWTVNFEKIKQNPLLNENQLFEILKYKKKFKIEIPSVTCDFFMEKPFFKKNKKTLNILRKIIYNGTKIGIKYFILPLVDTASINKNVNYEKLVIKELKKFRKYLTIDQKILFEIDFEPKKLKQFINNFNKSFGISYDSGNSASLGYIVNEEEIYFNRVHNIHIKDRYLNGATVRLGNGNCDFKSLFNLLKRINYNKNLILQTARSKKNHVDEINRNIKFIKKFL